MTSTTAALEETGIPWWLVLIEGVALIILGALLLLNPVETAIIAVQVLGIYWLIAGIFKIIAIFMDSSMWGLKLLAGILGIIAGIIVLNHPIISPLLVGSALVIILGVQGIFMGVVGILQAFRGAGWGTGILGAVSLIFGIILLLNIAEFTVAMAWAVGLLAVIGGIAAIVTAFRLK